MPDTPVTPAKTVPGVAGPALDATLKPVSTDMIATVNGQIGIFTPLTAKPDAPADPKGDSNVETIMAAYRKEIAALQSQVTDLQAQVAKLSNPPVGPEDFSAAVEQSLDNLQTQLSAMANPVSNFAVRDFQLESHVYVNVNRLGKIEYRFVAPSDKIDAAALSKVTLHLVPVPKAAAGAAPAPPAAPELPVEKIEGLSADQVAALHANGVDTVADFLSAGTRVRSSVELTSLLATDRDKLAGLLERARLLGPST